MKSILDRTVKGLILDMDGVLWRDVEPIGDLTLIFNQMAKMELRIVLATNNSTKTVDQYITRLQNYRVEIEPWQIITSSTALSEFLNRQFPKGGNVYSIGEIGLLSALEKFGFNPVQSDQVNDIVAVVAGMDREISFQKLRRATLLIRNGIPFYATNPDRTFPTPQGLIPGAGSLIAAIATASDVEPFFIGKPFPYMFNLAIERLQLDLGEVVVVGDRLETDIAGGQALGCKTAVVLSGVSSLEMAMNWKPPVNYVAESLSRLVGL